MKLESLPTLVFALVVFVPGFIYQGVLSRFVPMRQQRSREHVVLGFLTATAFIYAVCSPLLYYLIYIDADPDASPVLEAFVLFAVIFLVPCVLALMSAAVTQRDGISRLLQRWPLRLLRLRPLNPIPTGWDWKFSHTDPCFALVTLRDGTQIAGYFGSQSMASSDPDKRDLYLEYVYSVPDEGPWVAVEGSQGVYIDGKQIAFVEFKAGEIT